MADSIYDVIKQDHDRARGLLKRLAGTGDDAAEERTALYTELKLDLMMHQHVEEAVLYTTLRGDPATREDALEAINEHHVADTLLEELDDMPKQGDEWRAKFGVLAEFVDHHMTEEEEEFFENARSVLSEDQSAEMAQLFRRKKEAGIEAMTPVEVK